MGIAVKCRSRQAPGGLNRCGDLELPGMIQVLPPGNRLADLARELLDMQSVWAHLAEFPARDDQPPVPARK